MEWQKFYNDASRRLKYGRAAHFEYEHMPHLPEFNDLKPAECKKQQNETIITSTNGSPIGQFNSAIRQEILFPFSFTLILMRAMVTFFE